jgi:hypothetical protein
MAQYKFILGKLLEGSAVADIPNNKTTFQANISYEIISDTPNHTIPAPYNYVTQTYFDLVFNTLDIAQISAQSEQVCYDKLVSIYGSDDVLPK